MAIVAEGSRGRVYLNPSEDHANVAYSAEPTWGPEELVTTPSHDVDRLPMYGMPRWRDAFTPRQLVALTTFSDLVSEARTKALGNARAASFDDDNEPLHSGGLGAEAYADAIATYLACAISKIENIGSSIASWMSDRGAFRETFARQAIPMTWDFAEANPLSEAGGSFELPLIRVRWLSPKLQLVATVP